MGHKIYLKEENKMKIQRGFKAVKEEERRRELAREQRRGKLWRVFFPKDAGDDYEIPIRFLTDEPICYYEHTKFVNGKTTYVQERDVLIVLMETSQDLSELS